MKIRNGFVSNSSSSSFVVAFPKKPKSYDDVYEMMFNSKEGGIQPYDHIDGMSHSQIAQRVWDDINSSMKNEWDSKKVPAKKKDIIEEFSNRYYYSVPFRNVFWIGRQNDEFGGAWSYEINKYFGSDKKLMDELRDFLINLEKEEENINKRKHEIFRTEFNYKEVPYAYKGGMNNKTKKPYTAKEIKAYNDYQDAVDKFRKEHKEYAELENKMRKVWDEKYKKEDSLRNKIAKIDAEAFIKDHKDAFIAILSYADDGGDCTLEHGNIFKNLPNVKISHH